MVQNGLFGKFSGVTGTDFKVGRVEAIKLYNATASKPGKLPLIQAGALIAVSLGHLGMAIRWSR